MEEDMERLRARRRSGTHSNRGQSGLVSPSSSTFSTDSNGSSVILGLGTGAGIRDVLPLKSTFFDWCCEYFKEPQMRVRSFIRSNNDRQLIYRLQQQEADEPGSIQYNYQMWRTDRNEQIQSEVETQAEVARKSTLVFRGSRETQNMNQKLVVGINT